MTFFESVETCLSKFVTFTGRATRSEYWWFYLACMIASYAVGFLDGLLDNGIVSSIISLVFCIPMIAAGIRRMHDTGHSGWFILIPIYNLVLLCTKGEDQANVYGEVPAK